MHSLFRFYFLIVLTMVAAVGLPAYFVYVDAQKELLDNLGQRQEQLVQGVKREILLRLENCLLITDVLAVSPTLRAYYATPTEYAPNAARVVDALARASRKHAPESTIFLLRPDGTVALSEENIPELLRSFSVQDAIMDEVKQGYSLTTSVFLGGEEVPVFLSPVIHKGKFCGAVSMIWPLHSLMRPWENGQYTDARQPLRIYLVSKDVRLLFRSEGPWKVGMDLSSSPIGKLVAQGALGVQFYSDTTGFDRVGALSRISSLGWTVGVSTSLKAVESATQTLLSKGVGVALFFVCIAVALVAFTMSRMVKSLRQGARQMSMIMQGAGMGVWDCDTRKKTFSYNCRWAEVAGLPEPKSGEVKIDWLWKYIHPQDREVIASLGSGVGQEQRFSYEFRFRQVDGSWRWLQSWGRVAKYSATGKAEQLTGLIMDIDARKRMEQTEAVHKLKLEALVAQRTADLRKTRDEALAATEAKSFFLSTMSHEIRTPLNAVVGFIQLFERDNLRPKQRDYLDKIRTASQGLLAVINDVLDISKIEAGKLSIEHVPFSLRSVVNAVCSISGFAIRDKTLALTVEVGDDVPDVVLGDPTRLHQVLLNLLSNAIKFTAEGGIHVRAWRAEGACPALENGEPLLLGFAVRDTGVGMSQEQLECLFKPYSQADNTVARKFGGTGLGLAISRQLVEMMGGEISVTSAPGEGSEFTFTLCAGIAQPECGAPDNTGATVGNMDELRGALVLVVEDNLINQEIARAQLEIMGLEVDIAENGQEALDMLSAKPYALVFMDMQMPVMEGLTATRRIREGQFKGISERPTAATLPIIAMTANAMSEDRHNCLEAGMNDHLAKPFEVEELQRILLRWINKA